MRRHDSCMILRVMAMLLPRRMGVCVILLILGAPNVSNPEEPSLLLSHSSDRSMARDYRNLSSLHHFLFGKLSTQKRHKRLTQQLLGAES
jgi:hypothetical protein